MRLPKSRHHRDAGRAAVSTAVAAAAMLTASAAQAAPTPAAPPKLAAGAAAQAQTLANERRIVHVLNRLGYGPRPGDIERIEKMGLAKYIDQQLAPEDIDDSAVDARLASLTALRQPQAELSAAYRGWMDEASRIQRLHDALLAKQPKPAVADGAGTPAARTVSYAAAAAAPAGADPNGVAFRFARFKAETEKADQEATAEQLDQMVKEVGAARGRANQPVNVSASQLAAARLLRAVESQKQLQEVMVDFWTNHFNVDQRKDNVRLFVVSYDRDTIRPYALGRFRDLLGATAKSPAMLYYLDNYRSVAPPKVVPGRPIPKSGLNENYGREIMELHTLGVDGGYSQKDVVEMARCFTGWTVNYATGEFKFDPKRHDTGEKTVLGHAMPAGRGIEDGEEALDILASHPATIRHVSRQICQRLVADEPPASLVDKCAATWQRTGGNIRAIVRTIVTSPEFYSEAAYRSKYKSPFEFVVSSVRAAGGTLDLPATPAPAAPGEPGMAGAADTMMASAGSMTMMDSAKPKPNPADRVQPLLYQIAVLGQPLYQYQPPTGYPEDSRKWVSSGALIGRLNFAVSLATGRLRGVVLPAPDAADPATDTTPFLDRMLAACLGGDVTPRTRAALEKATAGAASPADAKTPQAARLASQRVLTLVLGSPEFQDR